MRKQSLICAILLILLSCTNKKREINNTSNNYQPENKDSLISDKSTEFLGLFKDMKPEGLHIYPPSWDKNGHLNKTPFEGIIIDVHKYPYLNDNSLFLNIQACHKGLSHIFAIGKFEINTEYYGLIMRQYSQYDESLIQLFLWDKRQKKIVKGVDLADSYGDEGWYFDKESWIIGYKPNSILKIITRRKDSEVDEDSGNKIIADTIKTNNFSMNRFIETKSNIADTSKYKLKEWQ